MSVTYNSSTQVVPIIHKVPRHIAIIMDGNGRWATKRFLPRTTGHIKGVESVKAIVEACSLRGIKYLTLFAFSSENWRRPIDEVSLLMRLFLTTLEREVDKMYINNIRLRIVGDFSCFDIKFQEMIMKAERLTEKNSHLILTICVNYGGRWDIMQAINKMLKAHPNATNFSEEYFAPYLVMAYAPEPDLFIRTGGEQRVSNFLLWQLAYSEFYFTKTYWPDFDAIKLDKAIDSYRQRERRFGQISKQLFKQKKVS